MKYKLEKEPCENGIELKNISIEQAKKLCEWKDEDKFVYKNARIKLFSEITATGVSLFINPNPWSDHVTKTFYKNPYLVLL